MKHLLCPPLSLYLHIPWCVRKCPYCDFNSHTAPDNLPVTEYVDALIRDLKFVAATVTGRTVKTIFIGGGTPSLLPEAELARLLEHVGKHLQLDTNCEITLEANPGTLEAGRFAGFRAAGVNRLSIGVQSFNDRHLKVLGRIHDANAAYAAYASAVQAGLRRINLDLMFGLPEQTSAEALQDLRTAIDLQPAHISWYQLTIEPNTVFYSKPPVLPPDDDLWDMQQQGRALMRRHGYRQYEVSAYARAGERCRHNLNYWRFGDYLGLGAGAHGKLTDIEHGRITRTARHRLPAAYMQHAGTSKAVVVQRVLADTDRSFEFMLNALRLNDGATLKQFEQRTGLSAQTIQTTCASLQAKGLLKQQTQRLCTTATGARFLNDVVSAFL
ncbi:MAG: radical SAM family heme chaperone HemW [Gammaproteobacteria bacterium]